MSETPGPKFVIENGWLAEEVVGCTGGACGLGYGHEPGCGLEPIATIEKLLVANTAVYMLRKVADYWDGRPVEHHGHHIYQDLLDVLKATEPDPPQHETTSAPNEEGTP